MPRPSPDAHALDVRLYRLDGTKALTLRADGDETEIDTSALTPGIYLLDVNGHSQKIAVK